MVRAGMLEPRISVFGGRWQVEPLSPQARKAEFLARRGEEESERERHAKRAALRATAEWRWASRYIQKEAGSRICAPLHYKKLTLGLLVSLWLLNPSSSLPLSSSLLL